MVDSVLLFLGSGVSFPSGLPDIHTITNRILKEKWYEHTDKNFYSGEHSNEYLRKDDITPKVQKFLNILKEFADPYFRSRTGRETNYEDLFYICQQIEDNETLEINNPLIDPFIRLLQFKLIGEDLLSSIELKRLAERAKALIQCVVWDSLSFNRNPKAPKGFDLILELKEKVNFIDIATLNHDTLIEAFLQKHDIKYADGFGQPEGDIRYFEPGLYDEDIKVKLFKLHGSINWFVFTTLENNTRVDKYGIALGKDINHLKDKNGNYVENLRMEPLFLTGTYNKMLDYNFGIFRIINTKFEEALSRNRIMIMSGYGWSDRGINGKIFEWIYSSPYSRLILLHEEPENLRKHSESALLWHEYDKLVRSCRLIPVRKWFCDVSLSEISKYLC